jgi:hypothetical protein
VSVPNATALDRLLAKIDIDPATGCWNFTGRIESNGYGRIHAVAGEAPWLSHRLAYTLLVGDIPEGLTIDHLCRNRACCNPDHLEPVTVRENIRRGDSHAGRKARQTHCKRGHAFDEANTIRDRRNGGRICRQCKNEAQRRYRIRRRSQSDDLSILPAIEGTA